MRTKTLLLSAAVLTAGLSASTAQSVFSVNAVGYVNVPVVQGYQIIANPLNNSNNLLSVVLPSVANNTKIYRFNPASQTYGAPSSFFVDDETNIGSWSPDAAVVPGEGIVLFSPVAATLTFVGEVPQGNLSNTLPPNFSIRSSIVPQSGGISSALGLAPAPNDVIYFFNPATQTYQAPFTFFFDDETNVGAWSPSEPSVAVGQGFVFKNVSGIPGRAWTRTFSVN